MANKCTRWDFCEALSKSISDSHRGVYINQLFDVKKGRETALVATLYSGEFKKGVIMNYCPFCGSKLGRLPSHAERVKRRAS